MSSKRKKIPKSRRPFSREVFFPKREAREIFIKQFLLEREFPNPVERKEYIQALIEGLETEPYLAIQ